MKRRFKMDYLVSIDGESFRNGLGDLHRDFDLDPSSLGCLTRHHKRKAFRLANRLAMRYGCSVRVEQCVIKVRHGKLGRWSRWTFEVMS